LCFIDTVRSYLKRKKFSFWHFISFEQLFINVEFVFLNVEPVVGYERAVARHPTAERAAARLYHRLQVGRGRLPRPAHPLCPHLWLHRRQDHKQTRGEQVFQTGASVFNELAFQDNVILNYSTVSCVVDLVNTVKVY
jgi:hypothetical protein